MIGFNPCRGFRALLSTVGAFLCLTLAQAEEFIIQDLSLGMHSFQSANRIPDNAASYIQNFYTDIESIAVERDGYVKVDGTVLGATMPVTGLWEYRDVGGDEWIIAFSSRTYYRSKAGQAFQAFASVATADQIPVATVNLGRIWFANGTDALWWFDGTSTGTVAGAPLGKLVAKWRNRLVISNISGALSTVRISEDGDGTSWALGPLGSDPFALSIGGAHDGQFVSCLWSSYLDNFIIGRKTDLWYLSGFDQDDATVRNISEEVGCVEHRTMQESNNALYWLSLRGVERMYGTTIEGISGPIRDITDIVSKQASDERSRRFDTQPGWESGTQAPAGWADTSSEPGSLTGKTTSFTTTSSADFESGTIGDSNTNTALKQIVDGSLLTKFPDPFDSIQSEEGAVWRLRGSSGGGISASGGKATLPGRSWLLSQNIVTPGGELRSTGTTIYAEIDSFSKCNTTSETYYISVGLDGNGSLEFGSDQCVFWFFVDGGANTISGPSTNPSHSNKDSTCPTFSSTISNIGTPLSLTLWISTYSHTWSIAGANNSGSGSGAGFGNYGTDWSYISAVESPSDLNACAGGANPAKVVYSHYGISPIAFTWTKTYDTGITIPIWDRITISSSDASGAISPMARTSPDGSSWGEWVTPTSGSELNADRERYVQLRASFTHTNYSGPPSSLDEIFYSAYSTGTWTSPVITIGDAISAWRSVVVNEVDDGNITTFEFNTSTSPNIADFNPSSWTVVSNASIPTNETDPYAAFRITYDTDAATKTAAISLLSIDWTEGGIQAPIGFVNDERYWLAFSTGTGGFQDAVAVWQRNNSWTMLKGINAGSFASWRNRPHFGDSRNTGLVYQLDSGNSDDGTGIVSQILFKSYNLGAPHREKNFRTAWLGHFAEGAGTYDLDYRVDRRGSFDSLGSGSIGGTGFASKKHPFPSSGPLLGYEIQYRITKSGTGSRLRLYDIVTEFAPREPR